MSKKREWFKWKLRSGRRGTLRRAGLRTGNGFEAMGACVAMLDHARGESHWIDNPEGVFKTSIEDLAIDYSTPEHRVRESLGALVATGWLNASGDAAAVDADAEITFRVVRYLAFNDPQGSDADRKAAERDRQSTVDKALTLRSLLATDVDADEMGKVLDLRGSVTSSPRASVMSLEGEGEGEEREETSVVTDAAPAPVRKRKRRKAHRVASPDVQSCFDWYCKLFGKIGRASLTLTNERIDAIEWALETYGKQHVADCLRGYHSDPWRREQLGRHDIEVLLRDEKHVEAGVQMHLAASSVSDAGGEDKMKLLASLGYGGAA